MHSGRLETWLAIKKEAHGIMRSKAVLQGPAPMVVDALVDKKGKKGDSKIQELTC